MRDCFGVGPFTRIISHNHNSPERDTRLVGWHGSHMQQVTRLLCECGVSCTHLRSTCGPFSCEFTPSRQIVTLRLKA